MKLARREFLHLAAGATRPVLLGIGSKGSRRVRKTARFRPSTRRRVRSPSAGRLLPHDTFRDLWPPRRPSQGAGIRCGRRCHLPGTRHAAAPAGSDRLMRTRPRELEAQKAFGTSPRIHPARNSLRCKSRSSLRSSRAFPDELHSMSLRVPASLTGA